MSDLVGNPEDGFSRVAAHMMNALAHHYHLGESTFIFRCIRNDFDFLFQFSMKFISANRIGPDRMLCSAASHLVLSCLPMSHKNDPGLHEINAQLI